MLPISLFSICVCHCTLFSLEKQQKKGLFTRPEEEWWKFGKKSQLTFTSNRHLKNETKICAASSIFIRRRFYREPPATVSRVEPILFEPIRGNPSRVESSRQSGRWTCKAELWTTDVGVFFGTRITCRYRIKVPCHMGPTVRHPVPFILLPFAHSVADGFFGRRVNLSGTFRICD